MRKNRLLAVVCAVVMNMSTLIGSIPVFAEETAEPNVQTDMKITGTSPLGEMLADKLTPEQTTLNEQNGCSIYDVKLSDKQAYVQFDTALDCTLLLTLFDDAEEKLLTSVDAEVTSEQTEIILDVPDMPEYCYLHCCLIDTETLAPVSAEYSSSLYTHEMQEFLLKTVDDFDEERVLNLDDDNTTNFAVFGDDVILLQSDESKNNVLSADEERKTYVLGNIDDVVRGLKQGDVFALGNDAVGMIIATVDMISIDGATATITGADMELEDVFDYLRLESNPDAMEITQEPTAPDEDTPIEMISLEDADAFFDSVTPVNQIASQPGQQKPPQYFPEIRFVDVEGTAAGIAFKVPISTLSNNEKAANEAMEDVLKSFEPKEGQDGFDFKNIKKPKIFADFVCKLDFKFKFYISTAHQYLKLEPTATIGVQGGFEIKGTYSKRLTKAPIGITFFKIISLEVVPRFEVEGKIKGTLEGRIKYKPVISFDSDKDQKSNYSPEPDVAFTFKAVGTVFIGFSFAPALDVVSDDKIALKLELKVGLEAKAEWSKQLLPPEDNQHECVACIDGEINAVCSMSTKLIVLNLPALTYEWKLADVSYHIGNFYYSIDRAAFGWGRCPYDFHKVTFVVLDNDDNPVNGAEVTAKINNQATSAHTGEDGKADLMMNAGKHSYTITKEGYKKYSDTVVVNNTSRLKYVTLSEENKKESGSSISGHRTPINLITPGDPSFTGTPDADGSVITDGVKYKLYEDHAEITRCVYNNILPDTVLYAKVNGLPVTSIGDYAFYEYKSLTSVTIPDSVTSIGDRAFQGCTGLTSITIPDSVTSIGSHAFEYCPGLTRITIPDSVTSIGDEAFYVCTGLTEIVVSQNNAYYASSDGVLFDKELNRLIQYPIGNERNSYMIPDSVTSIGEDAFADCTNLTTVTIPDSVTSIGDEAFEACTSLTDITIPDSVTSIGSGAFGNCTGLTSVTIGKNVTSIGDAAFYNCTGLTNITIPDSVTSIVDHAFGRCTSLTDITIPNSVTSIDAEAFTECFSLTSITIPDSVTSIGGGAFEHCISLTYVTIPDSVTSIDDSAFNDCESLTSITIPESVTSIGDYAFANCTGLTEIVVSQNNAYYASSDGVLFDKELNTLIQYPIGNERNSYMIPDSVTSIGSGAFHQCNGLTSITIPDSVTSIGSGAFHDCDSLTEIVVSQNNAYYASSDGVLFDKELNRLIQYPIGNERNSYMIPDSVTSIDYSAFNGCESLTSITIPESVTSIGDYAFANCTGLTNITIPDSVTSIGYSAFNRCESLTSITIPESVTSIGDYAFDYCTSLTDVYYGGSEEQWNAITIHHGDYNLYNATIHYNSGNVQLAALPHYNASMPQAAVFLAEAPQEEAAPSRDETDLTALTPNSVYNIYALADRELGVSDGNLLWFEQAVSDENGAVSVNYAGEVFAVRAMYNIANAECTVPELAYDGTEKEIFPTVNANGKTLTEGEDYWVSGSYTGTEPGGYSILLEGTGDWFGEKALTYVIEKEMTTDVTTTTTNLTTTTTTSIQTATTTTSTTSKLTTTVTNSTTPKPTTATTTSTTSKPTTTTTTSTAPKPTTTTTTSTTPKQTTTSTTAKPTTTIITTTETKVTTSETKSTEQTYLLGDVNADNEISVEDAQLALTAYVMVMAGMDSGLTDQQLKAADINGDGEVSVEDAQLILLYYVSNTLSHQTVTWDELLGKDKPPVTTTATTASTSKPTSTVTTATTSKK